mmetsp:Transcript_13208/g.33179  ORF Transcript_13208/g.33179 Transcript_13208/m.33179 type:complete len:276 (-) Transcript_13208:124-951(-)
MAANFWRSTQCELLAESSKRGEVPQRGGDASPSMYNTKVAFVEYIFEVGKRLKLRQRPISTSCVYIHRWFSSTGDSVDAFDGCSPFAIALSSLYLACKVDESPVAVEKIVATANELTGPMGDLVPVCGDQIVEGELVILSALSSSLLVHHPYRPAIQYLKAHGMENLLEASWLLIADTYHVDLALRYPPYIIALGCIYMAGAFDGKSTITWCKDLNVDEAEIYDVCAHLVEYYKLFKTPMKVEEYVMAMSSLAHVVSGADNNKLEASLGSDASNK